MFTLHLCGLVTAKGCIKRTTFSLFTPFTLNSITDKSGLAYFKRVIQAVDSANVYEHIRKNGYTIAFS